MVYNPEYNKIEEYKKLMIGKVISSVEFTRNGDEGLKIIFETGDFLEFAFSGCEGTIITEKIGA